MKFNRKTEIVFTEEDKIILDSQSKKCNWLYNHLLEMAIDDYKNNDNGLELLSGRNLRNMVPPIKDRNPFLYSVHSSPLKNAARRLKRSFKKFFSEEKVGYPRFRSWKRKWFSLYYDEPKKGFKVEDKKIRIALGVTEEDERLYVTGILKENLNLKKEDKIRNFRLCKEQGDKFYGIFCIERKEKEEKSGSRWLSIDPNHKNLFGAIDDSGKSFIFEKLEMLKFWDKEIDKIKSKRDKTLRKSVLVTANKGTDYYLPSRRWEKYNKALNKAYHCRREQIKSACFSIANEIARNYDIVAIGDYTPSLDTAIYKNMHRSMLNQEVIGKFRDILKWVMIRSRKKFIKVNERGTTKTCCICGHKERKGPEIREFICSNCKRELNRDINSAVNMAIKAKLLSGSDYKEWDLSCPLYTAKWSFRKSKVLFAEELNLECDNSEQNLKK